jgi:hypothetical protein
VIEEGGQISGEITFGAADSSGGKPASAAKGQQSSIGS